MALGVAPFVEERRHVDGEVLHHRHVAKRFELQLAAVGDRLADAGAAGPARAAVHHHGAGAAHADPAGEAVGQGGVLVALDLGDDVENGLMRAPRHLEGLEAAVGRAAPDLSNTTMPIGNLQAHDKKLDYGGRFEHGNEHGQIRNPRSRSATP